MIDYRRRALSGTLGSVYTEETENYLEKYFTIEALEDGLTAKLSNNVCEYRIDNGSWNTLSADINTPSINKGQTLSFRGNLTPNSSFGIGTFTISKKCNLEGNIMSLLYGDNFEGQTDLSGKDNAFQSLFSSCKTLQSTKNLILPATTLAKGCYNGMFRYCTSLTKAPELPATTLAMWCYYQMFLNCTSLTEAPELPATTLADQCYSNMFYGTNVLPDCSNIDFTNRTVVASGGLHGLFAGTKVTDADLEQILPKNNEGKYCLPVTTLANSCYYSMFKRCTRLKTAPVLPATTLANQCYQYMFQDCTSLKTVPKLPATTLKYDCYAYMFENCKSLTTAPELPATTLQSHCYYYMFYNCKNLTTAPKLPAKTLASCCYYAMFRGCTSLTTAPKLPAKTLADYCYTYMFQGCSLTTAPELPATTLASNCYKGMFYSCAGLTTAPVLPATTLEQGCYYAMFERCSIKTAPVLPATTLESDCYRNMFFDCSNLNYIKMLATNISVYATGCLNNWVNGVASSGTFVKHKNMTTLPSGESGIPSGWTVIDNE